MGAYLVLNILCFLPMSCTAVALSRPFSTLSSHGISIRAASDGTEPASANMSALTPWCVEPGGQHSHTAAPEQCAAAIEDMMRRDGPDVFMQEQTFWFGTGKVPKGHHKVPDKWVAGYRPQYCQIIIASVGELTQQATTDRFRLLDAAIAAQVVIDLCLGPSKFNLGGGVLIGPRQEFAVYVDGADPGANRHQNSTSPTSDITSVPPPPPDLSTKAVDANGDLHCFSPGDYPAWPVSAEMCSFALDNIVSRDGAEEFYKKQVFWSGKKPRPDLHQCPDQWTADAGYEEFCQITLMSEKKEVLDEFTLLNVATGAQRVMDRCVEKERPLRLRPYGGSVAIGDKGYFVAINGRPPKGERQSQEANQTLSVLDVPNAENVLPIGAE